MTGLIIAGVSFLLWQFIKKYIQITNPGILGILISIAVMFGPLFVALAFLLLEKIGLLAPLEGEGRGAVLWLMFFSVPIGVFGVIASAIWAAVFAAKQVRKDRM